MSSFITELDSNSSKQLKVNINESVANSIKLLSQALGYSQSQIVEESLTNYLNNSFAWRMRRTFLEKSDYTITDQDLINIRSGTEAYVVCKLDKDSTIIESISADIINIDSNNMVTIQLKQFLAPLVDNYKLNLDDDSLVIPKIVDWQPNNFNLPFQANAPYLHNYRYTIHAKYLWSVHLPYSGQVLNASSSLFWTVIREHFATEKAWNSSCFFYGGFTTYFVALATHWMLLDLEYQSIGLSTEVCSLKIRYSSKER